MARNPRRTVKAPRIMEEVYRVMLQGMMARGWAAAAHARQREPAAAVLDRGAIRNHLMTRTVHIIGAGLAGLAAAVKLAPSPAQGRRARSHRLSGRPLPVLFRPHHRHDDRQRQPPGAVGQSCGAGLRRGDRQRRAPGRTGRRRSFRSSIWRRTSAGRLRINDGLPWWIFDKSRRVPGTRLGEYLRLARLLRVEGRRAGRRGHRLLGAAVRAAGASVAAGGAEHRAARRLGGAGVGGGARDAGGGRHRLPAADRARRARPDLHRAGDRASARAQRRGAARPRIARAAL